MLRVSSSSNGKYHFVYDNGDGYYRLAIYKDNAISFAEQNFNCSLKPMFEKLVNEYRGTLFLDPKVQSEHVVFNSKEDLENARPFVEAYLIGGKLRG